MKKVRVISGSVSVANDDTLHPVTVYHVGDVIDVDDARADALIADGFAVAEIEEKEPEVEPVKETEPTAAPEAKAPAKKPAKKSIAKKTTAKAKPTAEESDETPPDLTAAEIE